VLRLLATVNVVPGLPIPVTPRMEWIRSSETSVLTRAMRYHIPEDGILNFTNKSVDLTENEFH
jgi:hypothetical protein